MTDFGKYKNLDVGGLLKSKFVKQSRADWGSRIGQCRKFLQLSGQKAYGFIITMNRVEGGSPGAWYVYCTTTSAGGVFMIVKPIKDTSFVKFKYTNDGGFYVIANMDYIISSITELSYNPISLGDAITFEEVTEPSDAINATVEN